jgi:hypothetical protein
MDLVLAVDGDLYVRGYNGQSSRWYLAARRQKEVESLRPA